MLFLMFGGFFGSWLDNLLKSKNTNNLLLNNSFMTAYKMSDPAFDFIGEFERYEAKAYKVKGENFYTIGYGSTRIFSKDGLNTRSVIASDYLSKDQAKFHLKMYYNNPTSPKIAIDKIIKQYGFKLNQKFYDMLCQVSYASGSFHRNKTFYSQYIGMLQQANGSNDVEFLGDLIRNTWISYLKAFANYTAYGLGWSRRAYASGQFVKGKDFSQRTAELTIKKPY